MLAIITALLYFLGIQKQKTHLQELGYDKPTIYLSTEETFITGFGVLLSIGDQEGGGTKYIRYVCRGIILALFVLAIRRFDALSKDGGAPWVWILVLLSVWGLSWEAQRQGTTEASKKIQNDKKRITAVQYSENGVTLGVAGHSPVLTDRMLILTVGATDTSRGSAFYIPTGNIQRIVLPLDPLDSPPHRAKVTGWWGTCGKFLWYTVCVLLGYFGPGIIRKNDAPVGKMKTSTE